MNKLSDSLALGGTLTYSKWLVLNNYSRISNANVVITNIRQVLSMLRSSTTDLPATRSFILSYIESDYIFTFVFDHEHKNEC